MRNKPAAGAVHDIDLLIAERSRAPDGTESRACVDCVYFSEQMTAWMCRHSASYDVQIEPVTGKLAATPHGDVFHARGVDGHCRIEGKNFVARGIE